jgi:hypothetical protein
MREEERRSLFRSIIQKYKTCFPNTPLPDSHWIVMWTDKYSPPEILAVIEKVAATKAKDKSTSDVGRIISATLRDNAKTAVFQEVLQETMVGKTNVGSTDVGLTRRGNAELVCGKCVFLGKPCNNHGGR